jgi:hypothetical protein
MRKSRRRREKELKIGAWQTPIPLTQISREEVAKFVLDISGTVVFPSDTAYHASRQLSNFAFQDFPQLIVYCETFGDVRRCLRLARKFKLDVALRSGGHSTAGFSINSGLVIDTSRMNSVVVDHAARRAFVGPGTRFGHLNDMLGSYGLHVPGGACQDVCVAGYMQGGGFGFTSRQFGMNCDNVEEVLVMLANGGIVTANANTNSDLFWAIRGGTGGNFGVLLQITYRLHAVGKYWAFGIEWPLTETAGDADRAARVLALMQSGFMQRGAPDELGYMAFLGWQKQEPYLLMRGAYHGAKSDGQRVLAPLLAITPNTMQIDKVGTYYEIDKYLLDAAPVLLPEVPDLAREDKQDGYIDRQLDAPDWRKIIDIFLETPNASSLLAIEPYGGAINRVKVGSNAFIHRAVDMDLYFDVFWMTEQERIDAVAYLDRVMVFMQQYFNGYCYQNYPRLKQTGFRRAYWGDWFDTLLDVKRKYDPGDFFHYPQSGSPEPDQHAKATRHTAPGLAQGIVYEPYGQPDTTE